MIRKLFTRKPTKPTAAEIHTARRIQAGQWYPHASPQALDAITSRVRARYGDVLLDAIPAEALDALVAGALRDDADYDGPYDDIDTPGALALLNTAILTNDGSYALRTVTAQEARDLLDAHGGRVDSAVGHESTAQILTTVLGTEVPVNRQQYVQGVGEQALVFKLHGRAPEGAVLSAAEVEEIGYSLKVLTRTA